MDHAILSPSGSPRWLVCTPSARLEQQFENKESDYAREGTLAHSICEALLSNFKSDGQAVLTLEQWQDFKDQEFYNESMQEHCDAFANYVLSYYSEGDILSVETRVDLAHLIPESFGRSDANIYQVETGHLHIFDLKYGKGKPVSAITDDPTDTIIGVPMSSPNLGNSQLKIYALGVIELLRFFGYHITLVTLHIYQPRIYNNSEYTITYKDLLEWGNFTLKPKAQLAFDGEGEYVAGKHCFFCNAKPRCAAIAAYNLELAKLDFAEPGLLTDDELIHILEKKPIYDSWIKAVADYISSEAIKGKKWPGYKLVEGKSNRVYRDEKAIEKALKKYLSEEKFQQIFKPQSLLGITEMGKLIGNKNLEEVIGKFIDKPSGAPTLAPISDKRPVYNPAATDFKDEWIDPEELSYDTL